VTKSLAKPLLMPMSRCTLQHRRSQGGTKGAMHPKF